jgi:hypothetical protein
MEAIRSSETSVQSTTSTRRHTPKEVNFQRSHRRENLKSYTIPMFERAKTVHALDRAPTVID